MIVNIGAITIVVVMNFIFGFKHAIRREVENNNKRGKF